MNIRSVFLAFTFSLLCSTLWAQSEQQEKYLCKYWRVVGIKMHKLEINEAMLKAKGHNMVLLFRSNHTYQRISMNRMDRAKNVNEWKIKDDKLIMYFKDPMEKKKSVTYTILQLSKKKLVLTIGEGVDQETYTYKPAR